jgi:hypothetical protein
MYLSLTEIVGIMIALGVSILLILITTIANYMLLKENRFLRGRLRTWRKTCSSSHVVRPF